jgi:hypothetical protein
MPFTFSTAAFICVTQLSTTRRYAALEGAAGTTVRPAGMSGIRNHGDRGRSRPARHGLEEVATEQ